MTPYLLGLIFAAVVIFSIFLRLRNSGMKERYAAWWFVVAFVVALISVFPHVLEWCATLVGIAVPINLAFFLGAIALLLVQLQLSVDLSQIEEKRRRLVEEIAIQRCVNEQLEARVNALEARMASPENMPHEGGN